MGDQPAMIKDTDMSEEVQQDAVECAILAIEKYNVEREIAALIKRVNVCLVCPFVEHDLLQKLSRVGVATLFWKSKSCGHTVHWTFPLG